ncbi:GlxA family transcriptional regulator [Halomonas janggokensis]|uniref:GlxA family transcriptional regulator n=1 Tax=Vreelandella janggokensis TaxID=370767 RepID=A0ABT4IU75_9GAMM|nr:GlxA family transcriptional regulator [Halomonas janggokensis]MCZ0927224.1 GlxA family transcriptional regulator [Halomonas janggokensis]MCZ0929732.1 GlxA family transcriptional regulator [Halomonas janggokensis]
MNEIKQSHIATRRVGFILMPGFALTSFSLAVEVLSVTNYLGGGNCYDYTIYSGDTDLSLTPIVSSNGIPIQPDRHFTECEPCDILVVCAHRNAARHDDAKLKAILRRQNHAGGLLVALSNGSLILARAGVLTSKGCTLVGDDMAVFAELYPPIPVREHLYTVDNNVLTCAGGMTALDLFLFIISRDFGANMANEVSHKFLQDRVRSSEEVQNARRSLERRMKSPAFGAAIELMEANVETPLSIQTLASEVGTTTRTLELLFQRFEHTTPARFYIDLRLDSAYRMLLESYLPISTIALACGFSSQSYFSRRFKERFHLSPREMRCS